MLAVRGVDKTYGAIRALVGVSLSIDPGEAVLLVGRNGAGKTTLLRILTGFLDPDAGDVTIDGHALASARAAAQRQIGYLPEHAPAPAEITVHEHLWLRARQKGLAAAAARTAVATVVAATELEDVARRPIGVLSKGFRQRVGLADAMLGEPPLLVLDEPTSGMDPVQTRQLCDHLIAAARARAVLVSSHAVADLERFASRVVVLRAGEIVADDAPAALCAKTGATRLEDAVVTLLGDAEASA